MVGRTISRYKILEKIGSGGMGEVYKAEDTKLHRHVALKFLAPHLLQDEEARKRFYREAQAAAALSHPNITTIHEIDETEGETFLALECVEGESLQDRIAEGPLPLLDALDIARQAAVGLQAAHGKDIVHRDIKPGNILITPDERVKVLDFGLALLAEGSKLTKLNATVGTVAYMSPEQGQGAQVDHRTDIWALGCVLYETISGQRPFLGQYDQALLYEIVNQQPEPLTGLRTGVPLGLELLVDKCLAKDPSRRYQSTAELIVDLEGLIEKLKQAHPNPVAAQSIAPPPPAQTAPGGEGPRRTPQLTLVLATVLAIALAALSTLHFTQAPIERSVRKWSFTPEALSAEHQAAVSPNGKHIAYAAGPGAPRLWVRDVDRLEPRELAGTEGASQPFWSPDSRFIGFSAEGAVQKVSIQGGAPATLCQSLGYFWGGSWSPGGESVIFSAEFPPKIFQVPDRGGQPRLLFEPERNATGTSNSDPHFLPPGASARSMLFAVGPPSDRNVALKNLESGESRVLAQGEYPVFSPSGHIVYGREGDLWALPFSLDALGPTGEAFPIVKDAAFPSVTNDGTLVAVRLPGGGQEQLVWRNKAGEKLGDIGQPQEGLAHPALSPNGRHVAIRSNEGGNVDIWVHEVERPMKRRLTVDAAVDTRPQWSPSGRDITFASLRSGINDIFRRASDGTGEAELLVGTEVFERPYGWSRDGNYLVYTAQSEGYTDIWYLKHKGDGGGFESVPFLATPFSESAPNFSPDGRFLAYCSNLSGDDEVYVRPFPSGDGQWQVSTNGGCQPRWSRDGKELFYVAGDTLTAVEVTTSPNFRAVSTTPLFSDPNLFPRFSGEVSYDVSSDGRFVLTDSAESAEAKPASILVVDNWYEEFRGRE